MSQWTCTSPPAEASRDDEEGLALHIRMMLGYVGLLYGMGSRRARVRRSGLGDMAEIGVMQQSGGYGVTDLLVREKGTKNMRKSLVTYPGSPGGLHLP